MHPTRVAPPIRSCWAYAAVVASLLGGACSRQPASDPPTPETLSAPTEVSSTGQAGRRALPAAIDTMLIRAHTRILAHDSLEGRGTASKGALAAALYIAEQLQRLGALPLPVGRVESPSPYLLPVPLVRVDVSGATAAWSAGASVIRLAHGTDFVVGRVGRDGLHAAQGPVMRLAGDSGAVSRGAWVLLDSSLGEAASRWMPAWKRAGAAGVVLRLPSDAQVPAYHQQLGSVRWQLRDGEPDPVWQPDLPVIMMGPTVATALDAPGARLTFDPRARRDTVIDYNVAGLLSADVSLPERFVGLTAHYDHLGIARDGKAADSIYNGFSDNAAGVAMLLAIGASVTTSPDAPAMLLLFPAAEESGLLGSLHFVRAFPDIVRRIQAVVNVDAGAPPAPPTRWRLAAGIRSQAGAVAAAVVEAHGWTHRSDAGSPNSDHWPFVASGTPAVFLIPDGGYEGIDDATAERLTARWDRYHRLDDEWSAEFPFAGLARYATLARDIALALGAADLD